MASPSSHEFLEHVGEVRLRVQAASWAALLAEAGAALAELALPGTRPAAAGPWREVHVEASDRAALLVDWLNELVFQGETAGEVPTEFEVLEAFETRLRARWRGVPVARPPSLVKAATLHDIRVEASGEGWECDVILDI